ncbi:25190_t:CDS:1, partial [Racocetra persica]
AVIVGQEEKKFISNPSREKLDNSPLELIVSATEEKIAMLEAGAQEISETELTQAITFAHQEIKVLIGFFQHIANSLGVKKEPKLVQSEKKTSDQWLEEKGNFYLGEVLLSPHLSWIKKEKKMKEVRQQLTQEYCAQNPQLEEEFVKDLVEEF